MHLAQLNHACFCARDSCWPVDCRRACPAGAVVTAVAVALAVVAVAVALAVVAVAVAAVLPPPLLPLLPVPLSAGVCEQPALITATMAAMARAASGRSVLFTSLPVCGDRVDSGSPPSVQPSSTTSRRSSSWWQSSSPEIRHSPYLAPGMTGDAVDHGGDGRETRRDLVVTGLAQHDPVIVLRLPSIQRMARTAKQPPASAVEPVLTPTTPWYPS
jgi:hypothetical protein